MRNREDSPARSEKFERPAAVGGLAVYCAMITGFFGILAAIFSFFSYNWVGTGASLAAAALAFGLVANAIFRD
jgi:hypothetical protein